MIEIGSKKATAFEYLPGNSVVHRLKPSIKILLLTAASFAVFRIDSFMPLLIFALFLIFMFMIAEIPRTCAIRDMTPLLLQLILTVPLALLSEGLNFAAINIAVTTTLKFFIMISSASLLVRTSNPWDLFETFRRVIGERLALMGLIAARYVPIMSGELRDIGLVQDLRFGGEVSRGIRGRLKRGSSLLIPYIQRSVRKADEIAVALHARGIVEHE